MKFKLKDESEYANTLENRLAYKFDLLQRAREEQDGNMFDSFAQSIEVLLRARKDVYDDLMIIKSRMVENLKQSYAYIDQQARNAPNVITGEAIVKQYTEEVDWQFREDYEEVLIDIMAKYDLIPNAIKEPAMIQPIKSSVLDKKVEVPEYIKEMEEEKKVVGNENSEVIQKSEQQKRRGRPPKLMTKTKNKFEID